MRLSRGWRASVDAARLVWPVVGGYRLLLPRRLERVSPRLRRIASVYRRRVVRGTSVVAVVGSLGKTTTSRAVAGALGAKPPPQAGNFGALLALTMLRIRPWHREAVVEVGIAGPGQMAPSAALVRPNVVVVMSIRSEHHRSFATIEEKRDEKAEMVRALARDGVAVLNGDDPHVRWMATQTVARVVTFGMGPDSSFRASDVRSLGASGTEFTLHADDETYEVRTRLLGRHMVYPALAALTVASVRGHRLDDAIRRLEAVPPSLSRLELVALDNGVTLVNDAFQGSLETIEAAIDVFSTIPAARHFVLLGTIEDPEGSIRPLYRALGERLAGSVDRVVMVGGDGLKSLVTGAVAAGMARSAFTHVGSSVHDAVDLLRAELAPGDALLIKGNSTQRLERVALALAGRRAHCPAKMCRVPHVIRCADCPLLEHDGRAFDNVHLQRIVS